MTRDLSIVARFHPAGLFHPPQWLARVEALFAADEWVWVDERAKAHVFASHAEAEREANAHRYTDAEGKDHVGWALVLSGDDPARPEPDAVRPPMRRQRHVTPEECFAENERRHLA